MEQIYYLTLDEAVKIHRATIEKSGGGDIGEHLVIQPQLIGAEALTQVTVQVDFHGLTPSVPHSSHR